MAIELGVLLGELKGSQSFEQIGSWSAISSAALVSISSNTTFTHSSFYSGLVTALNVGGSGLGGAAVYDYTASNDLYNRWWFRTDSHRVVSYFWNYLSPIVSSGGVTAYLGSESVVLPTDSGFNRYRLETTLDNTDQYKFTLEFTNPNSGFSHVNYIDDVLTAIDVIDLHPERNLTLNDELFLGEHQTIGGANPSYKWGFNKKWKLPLEYLEENEALLINQWWQDTKPLLFTWDTSDTTAQFIVTMTNNQTPITQFNKPYHDNWRGTLELSAFDTSLVF